MDPFVFALVAGAAILHVAWNVRLKTAGDPLRAATIGMASAAAVIVPGGIVGWWSSAGRPLPAEGIVLGIGLGRPGGGYFAFLAAAYRRGDLSVVYPIARGTAPLLAVAVGIGILGEQLGPPGSPVSARSSSGCSRSNDRGGSCGPPAPDRDPAVAFALATGVTIAAYSAVDRVGSRLIEPLPYAAILWVSTPSSCAVGRAGRRRRLRPRGPGGPPAAVGGWLTLVAYLLILSRSASLHFRRRPAPGVGHRARRGVGVGPPGRGGRPRGRGSPDRRVGADRRRRVLLALGRLAEPARRRR